MLSAVTNLAAGSRLSQAEAELAETKAAHKSAGAGGLAMGRSLQREQTCRRREARIWCPLAWVWSSCTVDAFITRHRAITSSGMEELQEQSAALAAEMEAKLTAAEVAAAAAAAGLLEQLTAAKVGRCLLEQPHPFKKCRLTSTEMA